MEQVLDKYAKAREDVLTAVRQIPRKFTLLDCFCGMGGVSDGFALEGFDVTGIDIVDAPKMLGYNHRFLQADMLELNGEIFRGYDVIWGSTVCRDFSILNDARWHRKKNPHRGLILVHAFLAFVKEAQPKIWILENVDGLKSYMSFSPTMECNIGHKRHVFYGNFPQFEMPKIHKFKIRESCGWDKLAHWKRSKIPLACSRAFARACKEKLLETQTT